MNLAAFILDFLSPTVALGRIVVSHKVQSTRELRMPRRAGRDDEWVTPTGVVPNAANYESDGPRSGAVPSPKNGWPTGALPSD